MSDPTAPQPQPMPQPVAPQPAALPNRIGLAALIVSIVAILFAVIPVISFIAWLPALAGLILAIIGLTRKGQKKATSGIALGLSILAGIIAIIVSIATVVGAASSVHDQDVKAANKQITVTYSVTSKGSSHASVTYDSFSSANKSKSEQDTKADLPFSKTYTIKKGGDFDFSSFSLVAQGSGQNKSITCSISADGKVINTNTSTGKYALATCDADSSDLDK